MFIFPCLRQGADWNTFDVALERLRFASSVFPLFRTTKKAFEKANRPSLGGFAWIERSEYQSTPWIPVHTIRWYSNVYWTHNGHREFGKQRSQADVWKIEIFRISKVIVKKSKQFLASENQENLASEKKQKKINPEKFVARNFELQKKNTLPVLRVINKIREINKSMTNNAPKKYDKKASR